MECVIQEDFDDKLETTKTAFASIINAHHNECMTYEDCPLTSFEHNTKRRRIEETGPSENSSADNRQRTLTAPDDWIDHQK